MITLTYIKEVAFTVFIIMSLAGGFVFAIERIFEVTPKWISMFKKLVGK